MRLRRRGSELARTRPAGADTWIHLCHGLAIWTRGHHAAMPYEEVPAFIASLRERDASAAPRSNCCILRLPFRANRWKCDGTRSTSRTPCGDLPAGRMKAAVRKTRVPFHRAR